MIKSVFPFISLITLLFGASSGFTQAIPNQSEFTADRMECYSPPLDYKCVYGHKPGIDEGITVVERPSLNVSVTYHYLGKSLLATYTNINGSVEKVNRENMEDVINFREFLNIYFPGDLQDKFTPVLKECQKQKAD